jgi:hypothetical protein
MKIVRVRDGILVIIDGQFPEAKEHLGGYLMVDCESPERAAKIARVSWLLAFLARPVIQRYMRRSPST